MCSNLLLPKAALVQMPVCRIYFSPWGPHRAMGDDGKDVFGFWNLICKLPREVFPALWGQRASLSCSSSWEMSSLTRATQIVCDGRSKPSWFSYFSSSHITFQAKLDLIILRSLICFSNSFDLPEAIRDSYTDKL